MQPETLGNFETFPAEFGRDGSLLDEAQAQMLLTRLKAGATDLLAISHGWNNDEGEAHELYATLLGHMSGAGALPAGRSLVVLLVYWPSKRFAEADLIPGGAAAAQQATVDDALKASFDKLIDAFTGPGRDDPEVRAVLQHLRTLSGRLEDDEAAQDDFVRLLRAILSDHVNDEEEVLQDGFFNAGGPELLLRLSRPFRPRANAAGGAAVMADVGPATAAGGAQGLGNLFGGIKNGALNLLNLFTYYEMKERAGNVGAQGVADLLRRAQAQVPGLRLHMCGHSFGGRLMAAALAAHAGDNAANAVRSLTLLQAAFSHWGFAQNYDGHKNGFFRAAFEDQRLAGPVLITHTAKDLAVGVAYPLASRLRNQVASGLGDENDPYGGMGRNGAQKTPEVDAGNAQLLDVGGAYAPLHAKRIYNLLGDPFITGHGDVAGPQVAHALWAALGATD